MRVQRKKGRYPTRTLAILLFVILMVATIFFSLVQFSSEAFFVLQKKNKEPRTEEATDLTNPALRNAMRTLPDASESVGVPLRGRDVPARPESQGTGVGKHEIFTDADDAALPVLVRAGEPKITQAVFLQCLADRLNVDVATRTQRPIDAESATPLIMFPIMMELSDHRAVMCNITNHIRYIMYVDNGGVPEVARFLNNIVDLFGWTGRLVVRSYPWNAGFSGAVNTAIDWALSLPEDEVPFLQVSNNDVRYPPGLYEARVRTAHQLTKKDAARISELQKEIEGEENSPAAFSHYKDGKPLRSKWFVNATVVTSQLLPDRIRYMPYLERLSQFRHHTGVFFFNHDRDFSSFMISRLAALTVGYFDENFMPAYFEDIDYSWRLSMLGFQANMTPMEQPPSLHLINAVLNMLRAVKGQAKRYAPQVRKWQQWMERVMAVNPSYKYAYKKWGTTNPEIHRGGDGRYAEPFNPHSQWRLYGQQHREAFRQQLEAMFADESAGATSRHATQQDNSVKDGPNRALAESRASVRSLTFNNRTHIPLDVWVRDAALVELIYKVGNREQVALGTSGYDTTLVRSLFS